MPSRRSHPFPATLIVKIEPVKNEQRDGRVADRRFLGEQRQKAETSRRRRAPQTGYAAGRHDRQETQQQEDRGEYFRPAHQIGDGLCVHGMDGEQGGRNAGNNAVADQSPGKQPDQQRREHVQRYVGGVKTKRTQAVKSIVDRKREQCERPIEWIAAGVLEFSTIGGLPPVGEPDGTKVGQLVDARVVPHNDQIIVREMIADAVQHAQQCQQCRQRWAEQKLLTD